MLYFVWTPYGCHGASDPALTKSDDVILGHVAPAGFDFDLIAWIVQF